MTLLSEHGARNIDDYNSRMNGSMQRVLVVIDEYTEALEKGGSKEEKALA